MADVCTAGRIPLHGHADLNQWGGTLNLRRPGGVIGAFASRQAPSRPPEASLLPTLVAELSVAGLGVAVCAYPLVLRCSPDGGSTRRRLHQLTIVPTLHEVANDDDDQRHQKPQNDWRQNVRSNEFHAEPRRFPNQKIPLPSQLNRAADIAEGSAGLANDSNALSALPDRDTVGLKPVETHRRSQSATSRASRSLQESRRTTNRARPSETNTTGIRRAPLYWFDIV